MVRHGYNKYVRLSVWILGYAFNEYKTFRGIAKRIKLQRVQLTNGKNVEKVISTKTNHEFIEYE